MGKMRIYHSNSETQETIEGLPQSRIEIAQELPRSLVMPPQIIYTPGPTVEIIKEIPVEKIVYIEKPVEVIREVIKEIPVEIVKKVPYEVIKEVPIVIKEMVPQEKVVDRIVKVPQVVYPAWIYFYVWFGLVGYILYFFK